MNARKRACFAVFYHCRTCPIDNKADDRERPLIVYEVIVNMVFVYLLRANIISSFGKPKVVALACILFHNKNSYASTA